MSEQPKFKCVAQLGDMDPVTHGGAWLLTDTTGTYPDELEMFMPYFDEPYGHVYRFACESCTYENGVLSDNEYHPEHPAWFAGDMDRIARFVGLDSAESLISDLCGSDAVDRARSYMAIVDYHGIENFDCDPMRVSLSDAKKRYAKKMYQV